MDVGICQSSAAEDVLGVFSGARWSAVCYPSNSLIRYAARVAALLIQALKEQPVFTRRAFPQSFLLRSTLPSFPWSPLTSHLCLPTPPPQQIYWISDPGNNPIGQGGKVGPHSHKNGEQHSVIVCQTLFFLR